VRDGHFDDEQREDVITRPGRPLPRRNDPGTEDDLGSAGGRFLYLRDDDSGDAWSPGWLPMRRDLDDFVCRRGQGYTVMDSSRGGIRAEATFLVPPDQPLEAWRIRVTNERSAAARVSVIGAVEFGSWDAQGEILVEDGAVYHLTGHRGRPDHLAWFASPRPTTGFETSREAFLGPNREWDQPIAVERGTLGSTVAHGRQPVGALHATLELEPGQAREVTFLLGHTEVACGSVAGAPGSGRADTTRARKAIARYRDPFRVDADLANLRDARTAGLAPMAPGASRSLVPGPAGAATPVERWELRDALTNPIDILAAQSA
jgi:cellobiose phosphorylase